MASTMDLDITNLSDEEQDPQCLTIDDLEVSAPRIPSAPSAMLEQRKRMRSAAVPTDDAQVRTLLREMGEPITKFSERQPERRERLKFQVALKMGKVTMDGEKIVGKEGEDDSEVEEEGMEQEDDDEEVS